MKGNPRHILTKEESKRGFRAAVESVQMKYGLDFNEAVQWILRKSARKAGYAGNWVVMREAGYKRANPISVGDTVKLNGSDKSYKVISFGGKSMNRHDEERWRALRKKWNDPSNFKDYYPTPTENQLKRWKKMDKLFDDIKVI